MERAQQQARIGTNRLSSTVCLEIAPPRLSHCLLQGHILYRNYSAPASTYLPAALRGRVRWQTAVAAEEKRHHRAVARARLLSPI